MRTSPDAHNDYVHGVNTRLGGKVKALIRLVKAWKFFCKVPITSFYLELRVAKYASTEEVIAYPQDLLSIFNQLAESGLARMQDPVGISGYIPACLTSAASLEALSKLYTAQGRIAKVVDAIDAGRLKDAFDWLNLLFGGGGDFPPYYY